MTTTRTMMAGLLGLGLLAGCGDSVEVGVPRTISGTASLGEIRNASITVFAADGSTVLGTARTSDNGNFRLQVVSEGQPVVIRVAGNNIARYFDEALLAPADLIPGQQLHAMLPAAAEEVAVTPLTELAHQLASRRGDFPLSVAEIDAANEAVRAALAPGLDDILNEPARFNETTTAGSLRNNRAGRYALVLAALAQLGNTGRPALATLNALRADLADGDIDSRDGDTEVVTPYVDFLSEMSAALDNQAAAFGSEVLQSVVDDLKPVSTVLDGEG